MNAGLFFFVILTVISGGLYIFTLTPKGKKWIKNL